MWDGVVLVSDHCLSFYFDYRDVILRERNTITKLIVQAKTKYYI